LLNNSLVNPTVEDQLDVTTTLLANPDITVAEIAERVGGVARDALSLFACRADGAHGSPS